MTWCDLGLIKLSKSKISQNTVFLMFKDPLETLLLAVVKSHYLSFPLMFRIEIGLGDHSVTLSMLLPSIRFVHIKGFECIRWKRAMSGGLVKNEECNATRVGFFKNFDRVLNLLEQLLCIPPRIPIGPWIDYLSCFLQHNTICITDNEAASLWTDEF